MAEVQDTVSMFLLRGKVFFLVAVLAISWGCGSIESIRPEDSSGYAEITTTRTYEGQPFTMHHTLRLRECFSDRELIIQENGYGGEDGRAHFKVRPSKASRVLVFAGLECHAGDYHYIDYLLAIDYVLTPQPVLNHAVWTLNGHDPPDSRWDFSGKVPLNLNPA